MGGVTSLNEQTVANLNKAIDRVLLDNPAADLSPILAKHSDKYARRKARRVQISQSRKPEPLESSRAIDIEGVSHVNDHISPAPAVHIISPLHSVVTAFINDVDISDLPSIGRPPFIEKIETAIERGKQLHPHYPRSVTQVNTTVVIKTVDGRETTEITALSYIRENSKRIPIPEPLGALFFDGKTYIFMSFIAGHSLQDIWPSLSTDQKFRLKEQMSSILRELRGMELPSQYLGCGSPPVCIDLRMRKRQSEPYIDNEECFNKFLLSTPRQRIAQAHLGFLQDTVLDTGHSIVMTHGDFTPRNLIVTKDTKLQWNITGVIDWECSGAYPEYWEYVKSLNTVSSTEEDDWAKFLPVDVIGCYTAEWAKHSIIDRTIQ